jgi:hypothetical protein
VLTTALARTFKYRPVYEPFNYMWERSKKLNIFSLKKKYSDIDFDNIDHNSKYVVKCMTDQHPDDSSTFDYFRGFAKKFKHVIILDRRNVEDQALSHAIAAERLQKGQRNPFSSPYSSDYPIDPAFVDHKINYYLKEKPKLDLLELDLGICRVWYEDLYSGDMDTIQKCIDKWSFDIDIQKLFKYIDPQHKYSKINSKSII